MNLLAHYFALHVGLGFLVPVVIGVSEPWTNSDVLLWFARAILAPICYFRSLPYMRWFAEKVLEISERIARTK